VPLPRLRGQRGRSQRHPRPRRVERAPIPTGTVSGCAVEGCTRRPAAWFHRSTGALRGPRDRMANHRDRGSVFPFEGVDGSLRRRGAHGSTRDDPRHAGHARPARRPFPDDRSRHRRLGGRTGRRLGDDRAAGRRPGPQRTAGDQSGRLGHPDPGAADRWSRWARRRLLPPAGAGHRAGGPRLRRARPRRRGRSGRATYRNRDAAGRPLRRRGRRLPHPAVERRGVPGLRRLGAGHRHRPLCAAGRRLGSPVAGRTAAAAVLGQGRRRSAGHRAHRRGIRVAAPPGRHDRGRRRAGAAGRIVRPQHRVAVPHRRRSTDPPGAAARPRAGRGRGRLGRSRRS